MTRDTDIARIAAVLDSLDDEHITSHRLGIAAALYDAGLRPSVEPAETTEGEDFPPGFFLRPEVLAKLRESIPADWLPPSAEPAGKAESYSAGNPTNVTEVELSDDFGATWREAEAALIAAQGDDDGFGVEIAYWSEFPDEPWSVAANGVQVEAPRLPDALRKLAAALVVALVAALPTQASDSPEKT